MEKGQKKIREFNEATEPQRKFMGNWIGLSDKLDDVVETTVLA